MTQDPQTAGQPTALTPTQKWCQITQSRTAKQQLDHRARVGRVVSSRHSAARRKVEAALAGQLERAEPSEEEGVVFNAEISAAIQESLAEANYGQALAARGITTVALNEDGELVEHRPDAARSW